MNLSIGERHTFTATVKNGTTTVQADLVWQVDTAGILLVQMPSGGWWQSFDTTLKVPGATITVQGAAVGVVNLSAALNGNTISASVAVQVQNPGPDTISIA